MSPLLIGFAALFAGLVLLVLGADRFVDAAAELARRMHLNQVVVGALVIGFGTSAPEMLVSAMAAAQGATGLAIGNAIGSNIANVGLVLGTAALIAPLVVDSQTRRCELPAMLLVVTAVWLLLLGGELGHTQGIVLLVLLFAAVFWITMSNLRQRKTLRAAAVDAQQDDDSTANSSPAALTITLVIGLVCLVGGSRLLVFGATELAREFGVPDVVIGLTIVAVGTSLPELAAAVTSVLRRELGLAIGNVVGSNIFNLLAVLAMPALISPGGVPETLLSRDYPLMALLCLAVAVLAFMPRARVGRLPGFVFLAAFCLFQYLAYANAIPAA